MSRAAFTLVELIAVMVILGALAAATAPIVASAGQSYADASNLRVAADDLAYALQRAGRTLRDAKGSVTFADDEAVELSGGQRLERLGTTLWLTEPGEAPSPLCQGVTTFQVLHLADDGASDSAGDLDDIQRLHITIERSGVWLATVIHLRGANP